MGVVYEAVYVPLGRRVALKTVRDDALPGGELLARFWVEALSLARLRHPNIVQIYEVGECRGRPWFAMEFADGGSLKDRLDGTPVSSGRAGRIARILARAVHHAHQHGVIHRDLKPANVLRTADGLLKVVDFGIAKQLDRPEGLTRNGQVLGTPLYMSPEQAQGNPREVGPAADVFALGAILYQLLTGLPPFPGPTAQEALGQVVDLEPVAPRALDGTVPRELEAICLRCLQKQPERRFPSSNALAEALRRFLARPARRVASGEP
jgi:serine/threonine protein kinase